MATTARIARLSAELLGTSRLVSVLAGVSHAAFTGARTDPVAGGVAHDPDLGIAPVVGS